MLERVSLDEAMNFTSVGGIIRTVGTDYSKEDIERLAMEDKPPYATHHVVTRTEPFLVEEEGFFVSIK